MQVAIDPVLYGSAQIYAERQGLNLSKVIEGFLAEFLRSARDITTSQQASQALEITPKVASLMTGHSWIASNEEIDDIRYQHIMEKYK